MKPVACMAAVLVLAQAPQLPRQQAPAGSPGAGLQPLSGQLYAEPLAVLSAERALAGANVLWPLVASPDHPTARYAIRAIGRLEDPANVPQLLVLRNDSGTLDVVHGAVARSLRGFDPLKDPELIAKVAIWLQGVSFVEDAKTMQTIVLPGPISNIAYARPEQVHGAEDVLRRMLSWARFDRQRAFAYLDAVRGLEALARLNARITLLDDQTVAGLVQILNLTYVNDGDRARMYAFAALTAARALTPEIEHVALVDSNPEVRRLAVAVLGGGGAGLDDEPRLDAIQQALDDADALVRYEAVRG